MWLSLLNSLQAEFQLNFLMYWVMAWLGQAALETLFTLLMLTLFLVLPADSVIIIL
jgi:hypothetical protein